MSQAEIIPPSPPETIAGIVGAGTGGTRSYHRWAWSIGGFAVVLMIAALLSPLIPRSLRFRADRIVDLPRDAEILSVETLGGQEYGNIAFRLPEPKGPGSRLMEVWKLAGLPASISTPLIPGAAAPKPAVHATLVKGKAVVAKSAKAAAIGRTASFTAWSRVGYYHDRLQRKPNFISYDGWSDHTTLRYVPERHQYELRRMAKLPPESD